MAAMLIATWNINSIKARTGTAIAWLREAKPDVLCLQEIKCESEAFPAAAFEDLGYNVIVHGQKTYNGVAILSKAKPEDVRRGLPGDPYDGHTLAEIVPEMEKTIGNGIDRILADAGYRGHNAPLSHKFKVYTSGQKRRMTPAIKREMRRRAAIEPVIGHI